MFRTAAKIHVVYGRAAIPNCVISQDGWGLRSARGGAAAQGGRFGAAGAAAATSTSCRCSRRSTICAIAPRSWTGCWRCRNTGVSSTYAAERRRSCSVIPTATRTAVSSPSGWELYKAEIGSDRGVPPSRRQASAVSRPGRFGRARRRAELRRHPGAARRRGAAANSHHRAGRNHLQQILECRGWTSQSGNSGRRDIGSHAAAAEPQRATRRAI